MSSLSSISIKLTIDIITKDKIYIQIDPGRASGGTRGCGGQGDGGHVCGHRRCGAEDRGEDQGAGAPGALG